MSKLNKSIGQSFDEMESTSDFVELLNEVYKTQFKKNKSPFSNRTINYYAFHNQVRYTQFSIAKRNGNLRTINAPDSYLKSIQQCINIILQEKFSAHHAAHGFEKNRNILCNASRHVGKQFVLNVDIEDFFHSVSFRRVKTVLTLSPFSLSGTRDKIGFLIANLCCHEGKLPQGSPTSPILTNIVCQRLDRKLFQFSKKRRCIYTRYADDLSFSSNNLIGEDFITELEDIIGSEGFTLNSEKTRIQSASISQSVTGLTVNRKVNLKRDYIRTVRAMLHNCEKSGYQYAQDQFEAHWKRKDVEAPALANSIKGRIEYMGMIRGKRDKLYLKYKNKYKRFFRDGLIDYSHVKEEEVRKVLEIDNERMEDSKLSWSDDLRENFKQYCVNAYLQIEALINYYFIRVKKFDEVLKDLRDVTKIDKKKEYKAIHQIPLLFKIYLFERLFYYNKGGYYDSTIIKIQEIRNDQLHRNFLKNNVQLLEDYSLLLKKIENAGKAKKEFPLSNDDKSLIRQAKAIMLMDAADFSEVRNALIDLNEKIKLALNE